jgi:hypothetical protein
VRNCSGKGKSEERCKIGLNDGVAAEHRAGEELRRWERMAGGDRENPWLSPKEGEKRRGKGMVGRLEKTTMR